MLCGAAVAYDFDAFGGCFIKRNSAELLKLSPATMLEEWYDFKWWCDCNLFSQSKHLTTLGDLR